MPNEEEIIVDDIDTTINTEETVNDDEGDEVAPHDDVESLKKTIKTLEAQKEHWRNKAGDKTQSNNVKSDNPNLSTVDIVALSKANIDAEDIADVTDWAKYKGISVIEALKSPEMKATLSLKEENRKSAQATNTGSSRRASSSVSDEQLLINARKGVMPESDADLKRLVNLSRAR